MEAKTHTQGHISSGIQRTIYVAHPKPWVFRVHDTHFLECEKVSR